ncbi:transient receptor potential cation channel subfamily M member 3-like [Mytilus californianus]|uniref:transient receptor potential cation channel subfamily M member 3-like n=1 Tax=Mytilus californianus TaxID=6549 RepID=UPI00224545A1|nr:transient receptor potential cation channel subfamily M member 3-like [Mytilus californianus]
MKTLWSNQTSFSKMRYKLPEYESEDDRSNAEEKRIHFIKWDSECYGLIFFALLQTKCWDGALQLLENGYIGIHHILVGCVILKDEFNNGKTEKLLKEKLKRLEKALTDKAISITSYIYEADKQNRKENKEHEVGFKCGKLPCGFKCGKLRCTDKNEEKMLNHAERLLLNHGYLRDAINTENNSYLESDTVRKILRKTFYGTEEVHQQTTLCIIVLAAVHMIALPLLMINMEARPLRWFYKKYELHYMKVYIHMLGFLTLLIAYGNMLLFDYRVDGITYTDYFIMLWMASFFVDETNQIIVAVIRGKWKSYSIDWWNLLDWLMITLFTTGMLLKTGEGSGFQITSKLFLVVTFTALCTRLLHLTCMTEFLGRKLVINRKMIKDTSAFMIIITIIMLWYSVSFYALLYPNSEFSWKQMEKILRNGYWMLFGDLNIDATDLECTNNKTLYERGVIQRCPSDLGVYVTPYLKAFYGLLAVVLLLNLLIAMYSDTYTKVQQNANLSWLQMQIDLFEEYRIKTVFPIHLQLLALPGSILAILWFCYSYLRNKYIEKTREPSMPNEHDNKKPFINDHPVFVRVFLYDTNYDIKPKTTYDAEMTGIYRACEDEGKIDLSDSDAITTLNRLRMIEDSLQDMREKEDRRNQELMKRDKKIEQLLTKIAKELQVDEKAEQILKTKEIPEEANQKTEF